MGLEHQKEESEANAESAFPEIKKAVEVALHQFKANGVMGFTKRNIAEAVAGRLNNDPEFQFTLRQRGIEKISAEEIMNIEG